LRRHATLSLDVGDMLAQSHGAPEEAATDLTTRRDDEERVEFGGIRRSSSRRRSRNVSASAERLGQQQRRRSSEAPSCIRTAPRSTLRAAKPFTTPAGCLIRSGGIASSRWAHGG